MQLISFGKNIYIMILKPTEDRELRSFDVRCCLALLTFMKGPEARI